jgi:hypothetical protein
MAYPRCTASSTTEDARGISPDSRTHNIKLSYGEKEPRNDLGLRTRLDEFVPFLAFPSPIRKVLPDPTGLLESDGRFPAWRGSAVSLTLQPRLRRYADSSLRGSS